MVAFAIAEFISLFYQNSMENSKISSLSRILLIICGIALLAVLITPMWRIDLQAPQYPEGLKLLIYPNKLSGNVDIINGLNHYIGMKTLHTNDFPEFKILPGIIIFFSIVFILTAIVARRKWVYGLLILFVAFGIVAMIDFWRWEYDYGHNLNPDAAIIVPGMAYQPPLIGYKQLLNFGAYSVPDIGGWIFVAVGAILFFAVIYEWRRKKKESVKAGGHKMAKTSTKAVIILGLVTFFTSGCSTEPEPLRLGKDNCDFCKMTISDNRFGGEIVTKKSKVYKFDDERCIIGFLNSGKVKQDEIGEVYFVDFMPPHEFINVRDAQFLQSPNFKSPMNGNIAAFSNEDSLAKVLPEFFGNKISWEDMQK